MTQVYLAWLTMVAAFGLLTLWAVWSRRDKNERGFAVLAFVVAAAVSAGMVLVPMGYADRYRTPVGDFTVLGGTIVKDVAIYVLIQDGGSEPHYYKLPYSAESARQLQDAMDATAGGRAGGVKSKTNAEGKVEFYPAPVPENPPKTPEIN